MIAVLIAVAVLFLAAVGCTVAAIRFGREEYRCAQLAAWYLAAAAVFRKAANDIETSEDVVRTRRRIEALMREGT